MRRLVVVVAAALVVAGCGSVEVATRLDGTRPVTATGTVPGGTATPPPTGSGPTAGTGPDSTGGATPGTPADPTPAPLAWQACGARLQCATLTVPKDYRDLSKGTLDLFVKKRPAAKASRRIGTLLANPGGPGVPGTVMADQATGYFGPALLDRFDLVAWDPRGTGKSGQIVCVDSLDPYFAIDLSPDDAQEWAAADAAAADFGARCAERNPDLLPYVTTEATARDMDQIRKALGEQEISYFGFSYGSELGAVWATLFPATVRAMVIDGALDPRADAERRATETTTGLERSLDNLLAACAADRACPVNNGGDPGAAYDRIMAALDRSPLPSGDPTLPAVTQGVAYWATLSVLYDSTLWPALTSALAEAQRGNGRALADLYRSYVTSGGVFPHVFESLIAIRCADLDPVIDGGDRDVVDAELRKLAPRTGPYQLSQPFCKTWPARGPGPVTVTGKGAGPVVVVGTTGDPVTPLETSRGMAEALEGGVLVVADADKHTGYGSGACIDDAIETYLLDLVVPTDGLVCKGG